MINHCFTNSLPALRFTSPLSTIQSEKKLLWKIIRPRESFHIKLLKNISICNNRVYFIAISFLVVIINRS